jgi:hypothetical protein
MGIWEAATVTGVLVGHRTPPAHPQTHQICVVSVVVQSQRPVAKHRFTTLALVVAGVAWRTSVNALRTSYRPVIRAVPARDPAMQQNDATKLILKNIGFGPALSIVSASLIVKAR